MKTWKWMLITTLAIVGLASAAMADDYRVPGTEATSEQQWTPEKMKKCANRCNKDPSIKTQGEWRNCIGLCLAEPDE